MLLVAVMFIALIVFIVAFIYRLVTDKRHLDIRTYTPPPRMEVISPTLNAVISEYRQMYELIRGSATLPELTYLQNEVFEWLDSYKGLANITEYFTDLMSEIEAREVELRALKIQTK